MGVKTIPGTGAGYIEENLQAAYKKLRELGYSHVVTIGILANLAAESQIDPRLQQQGGGPGRGIAQWEEGRLGSGRWNTLTSWATQKGKNPYLLETQLEFLHWELNNSEAAAGRNLKSATSVADAARIFMLEFERPKSKDPTPRIRNAQYFAGLLPDTGPSPKPGIDIPDNIPGLPNEIPTPSSLEGGVTGWLDRFIALTRDAALTWIVLATGWLLFLGGIYILATSAKPSGGSGGGKK